MGQNWWWVVLAVAVIVVLAVLLVRWRVRRGADAGTPPPSDVEIAAAAAGGAGGAIGAAGVAASRGEAETEPERAPADTAATDDTPEPDRPAPLVGAKASPDPAEATDQQARRVPEPADSALAALDSGLVGSTATHGAAADAVAAIGTRPGPHPGSAHPTADGSPPSPDYPIKANEGSRRYHTPDSPYYVRTRADLWFRTAQEAHAAGFTAWDAGR